MRTTITRPAGLRTASARMAKAGAAVALVAFAGMLTACHDLLTPPLPAGTQDPSVFNTETGAVERYVGAIETARARLVGFAVASGKLADELHLAEAPTNGVVADGLDERILPEVVTGTASGSSSSSLAYIDLQRVRGSAAEAIGALAKYAPAQPAALRGELYAIQGYAEIGLADLFCSGIPLSTLDFEGDFTYRAGSTTSEVYQHAIALFDTARTLGADSTRIVNVARVGTARALLDLGQYAEAAQAVADVPDDFRYDYLVNWVPLGTDGTPLPRFRGVTVANAEGGNGLDYIASGDPRTLVHQRDTTASGQPIFEPAAYVGVTPFTLASGTEARLIEAEAALDAGDAIWLATLNALRTDGTFDTQPNVDDPTKTDTLWHAGTAGVAGLKPLDDPGTQDARVDLLFRERAFWLFVTGHRQGDLRRLLRQYHRQQNQVYPTGFYQGGLGAYGSDVTAPIPPAERVNPLFTGCFNRNP